MCGLIPNLLIDPAWSEAALDQVGDLLRVMRCRQLGLDQPPTPLAFTKAGEMVTVQRQSGLLRARPITPEMLALDLIHHVCRPMKMPRGWWRRACKHDAGPLDEIIESDGVPCGFPLTFARAFLVSRRIDQLPMLTSHYLTRWQPDSVLRPEWNLFADRILEVPVEPPVEPPEQLLLPLPRVH